jgi:hypothetical protein
MHGVTISGLVQLSFGKGNSPTQDRGTGVPSGVVNGRTIALTVVGFLLGMLAAGSIGVRVIEEVRAEDDATSLPAENVSSTANAANEYFIDPAETLIASAVVVPTAIVDSGSSVGIEYDIVSVAPAAEFAGFDLPPIIPRTWEMAMESGSVEGSPASPGVSVFELPPGSDAEDIRSVEIVDPLVAYPLDVLFALSPNAPSIEVTGGVTAELVGISMQGDSTTVQIGLVAADPIDLAFFVEGVGPGWRSMVPQVGSPMVELLWVGDDLPDVLTLRAAGVMWVTLEGLYPVSLEGLQ